MLDINNLIDEMTLIEKVVLCFGGSYWRTSSIPRLKIPSITMIDGPNGINKQEFAMDKQCQIIGSTKTICFPSSCCTCCSFDKDLLYKLGESFGDEMIKEGISILLGPGVNIKRSPLGGRNFEYFSEDPFLTTKMAGQLIKGIQSKGVGACIKHFAANNQETQRFTVSAQIDERTLHEIYLAAFEGAIKDSKPWAVMSSYNQINGLFSSDNYELLTHVLRDEWKWNINDNDSPDDPISEGIVMSDWGGTHDRVQGFKAGLDLEMPGTKNSRIDQVIEAVKQKKLDVNFINKSVKRVLNVVFKAQEIIEKSELDQSIQFGKGMENIEGFLDIQHEIAREVAENSIVLLKNDDSILPLPRSSNSSKKIQILFVGKYAKNPHFQGGGCANVDPYKIDDCYNSSIEIIKSTQSITKTKTKTKNSSGVSISFMEGFNTKDGQTSPQLSKLAIQASQKSDIVVVFAGTPEQQEVENKDQTHIKLPKDEDSLISEIAKVNKNVVVVLQNGSPVEMPWVSNVKAILETYFCGEAGGKATANVLFGLVNPSGHLSESFPFRLKDTPCYKNFPGSKNNIAKYKEGIFVGYRHYDRCNINVLFPFGHGLSYTEFKYKKIRLFDCLKNDQISLNNDDSRILTVLVDVENVGPVSGKTVAQLYVSDKTFSVERPVKELKGFEKVSLNPGEVKTVEFHLNWRSFAYWNTDIHSWHVSSGDFQIIIGQSSRDKDSLILDLKIKYLL
ncbi:hypothetical protein M9Y10_009167 [Tritrichomonas musculus]|uniref:beta-glucosidase n=1 Tax=Tritrichomonas musculus TaxID=1915356 RepID=A0ABR2INH5_9EUKA